VREILGADHFQSNIELPGTKGITHQLRTGNRD
jgi:hypothetical protein